jgi:hypothetical protein
VLQIINMTSVTGFILLRATVISLCMLKACAHDLKCLKCDDLKQNCNKQMKHVNVEMVQHQNEERNARIDLLQQAHHVGAAKDVSSNL